MDGDGDGDNGKEASSFWWNLCFFSNNRFGWLTEWVTDSRGEWVTCVFGRAAKRNVWLTLLRWFSVSFHFPTKLRAAVHTTNNTNNCLLLVVHDLEENNTEPPKLRRVHRIAQTYKPVNGALRKTDQCTTTTTTSIHSPYLPHSAKTTTTNHCCGSRPLSGRGSKL